MRGVWTSVVIGAPLVWAGSTLGAWPGLGCALVVTVVGAVVLGRETLRQETAEDERRRADGERLAELSAARAELATAAEQLVEAQARAARLEASLDEARSSRAAFLATVSHELRTPLHAIIGFTELVGDGATGPVNAKQREYLGDARAAAQHLMTLITDVLDYAKADAGRLTFHADEVRVAPVVEEVVALVEGLAGKKDLRLVATCEEGLSLTGDALRVKQVLLNLVANAIKFTPRRGQIEVTARAVGRLCELSVRDTGPGIALEEQRHIFEPFHQSDTSRSRRHSGTGLGLSLVKRWAEAMGGCVEVVSELGAGACFTVSLPVRVKHASLKRVTAADRPDVLVAEDDEATRLMVSRVLEAKGCQVRQAANGQRALEAIMEGLPAVLVLDLMMPELDGFLLLEKLRMLPNGDRVKVLVFSASNLDKRDRDVLEAFGAELLVKGSMSPTDLARRVHALVTPTRSAA